MRNVALVMRPPQQVAITTGWTCDRCKKVYDDELELQEFLHIDFTGGYNSVFGDMVEVECDICQHCLKEMIGDICRKTGTQ